MRIGMKVRRRSRDMIWRAHTHTHPDMCIYIIFIFLSIFIFILFVYMYTVHLYVSRTSLTTPCRLSIQLLLSLSEEEQHRPSGVLCGESPSWGRRPSGVLLVARCGSMCHFFWVNFQRPKGWLIEVRRPRNQVMMSVVFGLFRSEA